MMYLMEHLVQKSMFQMKIEIETNPQGKLMIQMLLMTMIYLQFRMMFQRLKVDLLSKRLIFKNNKSKREKKRKNKSANLLKMPQTMLKKAKMRKQFNWLEITWTLRNSIRFKDLIYLQWMTDISLKKRFLLQYSQVPDFLVFQRLIC